MVFCGSILPIRLGINYKPQKNSPAVVVYCKTVYVVILARLSY